MLIILKLEGCLQLLPGHFARDSPQQSNFGVTWRSPIATLARTRTVASARKGENTQAIGSSAYPAEAGKSTLVRSSCGTRRIVRLFALAGDIKDWLSIVG